MNSIMTILRVMPGCKPERIEISHTLEAMQAVVGGYIQAIYPYEDMVAIVCNGEGKLLGMVPNRAVRNDEDDIVDIISGTFFICGLTAEDFCSLTEKQIEKYSKMFEQPELFFWTGRQLIILPAGI